MGSLAFQVNWGRLSRLLVIGSALGGISSVVEDERLLVVHRERRRWRLGRERMLIEEERGTRWSHRASACAWSRRTSVRFTARSFDLAAAVSTEAASHATVSLNTRGKRVDVCWGGRRRWWQVLSCSFPFRWVYTSSLKVKASGVDLISWSERFFSGLRRLCSFQGCARMRSPQYYSHAGEAVRK